jgi:hypothetical protein
LWPEFPAVNFPTFCATPIVPCATGTPITAKYAAADSYIFRNAARDAILVDGTAYGQAGSTLR